MARKIYKRGFPFKIENNILIGEEEPIDSKCTNIGELILSKFRSRPDFVGQIDAATAEQNTFQQMRERSVKCALWLKKQNIKQGDIVVICTHNHLNSYIPCLASTYVGAIVNSWSEHVAKSAQQIDSKIIYRKTFSVTAKRLLQQIVPKMIFVNDDKAAIFHEALTELNIITKIIVFGKAEGFESLESILNGPFDETEIDGFSCTKLNIMKDTSFIFFSSGTTGISKGVEIIQASFLAPSNKQAINVLDGDNVLWFGSLNWISGLAFTLQTIFSYATAIKSSVFDADTVCRIIEKYKVNLIFLEGSMCTRLVKSGVLEKYDLPSLRRIIFGGSQIIEETNKALIKLLPNTAITGTYGMTEATIICSQLDNGKIGSSGYVLKNMCLKFVDVNTGKSLGPNQPGEIWCKTPFKMNGYHKEPEMTINAIDKDGWLRTGDLSYYDEDGAIFILSRIKELIKYRGHHVPTGEIENLLHSHPAVVEAAVVAMPHDIDLEHPIAFVTKVPNAEVTEEELKQLVAENMEDSKKLRGGVVFLNEMPRNANGKIERKKLRDMAKAYAEK